MDQLLFFVILGGWGLAFWWTEGAVWAFGWLAGIIALPILFVGLLLFGKHIPGGILSPYGIASGLTAILLLRGEDTTWTLKDVAIAATPNLAGVAFLSNHT